MRIGFIYSGYAESLHSGILRFERALYHHLETSGDHEVRRLVYPISPRAPELWQQYFRIARPLALRHERRFIDAYKPDLLIIQGAGYPEGRSLSWYRGTPTIVVQHGYPEGKLISPWVHSYMHTWGKASFTKAIHVVAVSAYTAQKIEHLVAPEKLSVISSSAIHTDIFFPLLDKASLRAKFALPTDATLLISTGRLVGLKNQAAIIRALPHMTNDTQLLLIGDGPDRHRLERLAKNIGVRSRVRFFGFLKTDQEVNDLLNASDIFVFPSLAEGLGLTPLEAMATKLPVISSTVGGLSTFITNEKTALALKNPRDAEEIATAVDRFHNDHDLATRVATTGYDAVQQTFNIQHMCAQWDSLLRRLHPSTSRHLV